MVRRPALHSSDRQGDPASGDARSTGREPRAETDRATGAARNVKRFLVILALLGTVQVVVMLGVEAYRAVEGQRAIQRLHNDIAALEAEAAGLAAIVQHADDPAYREQLARRRGFLYPDEVRIVPLR
jgi:cell division protein FtsB